VAGPLCEKLILAVGSQNGQKSSRALTGEPSHYPINQKLCSFHHRILLPEGIISHVVDVHLSVEEYSTLFRHKWRRPNYATPKNFLDFINRYLMLLEEKDKYILGQVWTLE